MTQPYDDAPDNFADEQCSQIIDDHPSYEALSRFCSDYILLQKDMLKIPDLFRHLHAAIRERIGVLTVWQVDPVFLRAKELGSSKADKLIAFVNEKIISAASEVCEANDTMRFVNDGRVLIERQRYVYELSVKVREEYDHWLAIQGRKDGLLDKISKLKSEISEFAELYVEPDEQRPQPQMSPAMQAERLQWLEERLSSAQFEDVRKAIAARIDALISEFVDDEKKVEGQRNTNAEKPKEVPDVPKSEELEGFGREVDKQAEDFKKLEQQALERNRKYVAALDAVAPSVPDENAQDVYLVGGEKVDSLPERTATITVKTLYAYCVSSDRVPAILSLEALKEGGYISKRSEAVLIVGSACGEFLPRLKVKGKEIYATENALKYLHLQ